MDNVAMPDDPCHTELVAVSALEEGLRPCPALSTKRLEDSLNEEGR